MIFRLSHNLNKKIKAGSLNTLPLDENPYADWSANLFTAGRTQYIILSNTKTLYSCVMCGKGITSESIFIEHALKTIREFMADDGEQFVYRKFIALVSDEVQFAKALNRSVTGSMNEPIHASQCILLEENISPHEVGFRINEILLSALTSADGNKYATPREAFKLLAERCESNDEAGSG